MKRTGDWCSKRKIREGNKCLCKTHKYGKSHGKSGEYTAYACAKQREGERNPGGFCVAAGDG